MSSSIQHPSLELRILNGLPALTDEALFAACGVRIAFTGRAGGVSEGPYASLNTASHVGDDLERVQRNREIALEALGGAGVPLVVPNQVHGTHVVQVDGPDDVARAIDEADQGADIVVVRTSGVGALMSFADCLSLIVVSPSGRFAMAHAGWRGAVAGVAGKAVRALELGDDLGADAFNAYIGPHIRSECFEVGEDVAGQFVAAFGEAVIDAPRHVDLSRAVSADFVRAGVRSDRIADAAICTKCHPDRYFSYRADGVCGRHAAIAFST